MLGVEPVSGGVDVTLGESGRSVIAERVLIAVGRAPVSGGVGLENVRAETRDGFVVVGFHTNRELPLDEFDRAVAAAGLRVEHRFATWDLRAWHADADFAVTVLRHPA